MYSIVRDIGLRFITAVFLLQVLVPFFAVYGVSASQVQAALAAPEIFGEKVLICTRDGFAYVSWQQLAEEEKKPQNTKHSSLQCPSCYVQTHAMTIAADAPLWQEKALHRTHIVPHVMRVPDAAGLPRPRVRAPPHA
jgi:hypothetical protein